MKQVYLSIGTNIGNKYENIKTVLNLIEKAAIKIVNKSFVYATEPIGVKNQPDFYNICVEVTTEIEPKPLLIALKAIEVEMGRIKEGHWGPRIIDIDILFYSNIIFCSPELTIPHCEIVNRRFVLEPLNEIAGGYVHPVLNLTVKELLNNGNFSEQCHRIGEL